MNATTFHQGRRLAEDELLPERTACPVCLADGRGSALLTIQREPRVELLACGRCGAASASRMPKPDVLARYYADYYSGRERRITVGDAARFGRAIASRLGEPAAPGEALRILDFGGGDGSLGLEVAKTLRAGWGRADLDVTVVDHGEPWARNESGIPLRGVLRLEEAPGPFAVVLASAVFEHVPELHATARAVFSRVARGGAFYARTPYLAPFGAVFPSLDLTFPAHVHDLGPAFWGRVADTFGLAARVVRSAPSPVEADVRTHPLRALFSHALKLPARIESRLGGVHPERIWRWVGGWEAVLRF